MPTESDVSHTSPNPTVVEGDRCAHCDRAFEVGDLIRTYPVLVRGAGAESQPVRFRHLHEGCALFYDATKPSRERAVA